MYKIINSYFIKNVIILFVINNFSFNQEVSYIKIKYLKLCVFQDLFQLFKSLLINIYLNIIIKYLNQLFYYYFNIKK